MIIYGVILLTIVIITKTFTFVRNKKLLETVTNSHRGTKSERKLVLKLLKEGFPAQTIFHDLYVSKKDGNYSQIDLVLATKVGIVVFEVKEFSGWIFGNGNHRKWTQVLAHGKHKYYFYNPIFQNNKHIENLKLKLVDFKNIPFFSVVVFFGGCEFRDISFIPNTTFLIKSPKLSDVLEKIMGENKTANYKSKRDVVNVFSEAVDNGNSKEIIETHIKKIQNMLGEK